MVENYPSNSKPTSGQKSRAADDKEKPEKKVEKVVQGEAVRRKKPMGRRFIETFVGGEDARSVFDYILRDVLVPAAKDTLTDAVTQGIERMVFGDVRHRQGGSRPLSRQSQSSYTPYNRAAAPLRREEPAREMSRRGRATHDFDEIVLPTRVDADEALSGLYELLSNFDVATVADLYELVGITGHFTDEKYGWTSLAGSGVERVRGGFLLNLPRPVPLD